MVLGTFFIHAQKSETCGKNVLIRTENDFLTSMHPFHGFTPVEISLGFVKFFFIPNQVCQ